MNTRHNNPHHAINRAVYAKAMADEQAGKFHKIRKPKKEQIAEGYYCPRTMHPFPIVERGSV